MNPLHRFSAATAAAVITTSALHAQVLSSGNPNYSTTKLFDSTPGFTITGLGAAPGGDIFYIESDSGFTLNARLLRRSPSDGYASATPLFDFGAPIFGSFVAINGGKVFFGESSTGAIRSINPDGSGLDALGSIPGNYDLAFGTSGLFLSHNPGGFTPQGKVSKFELVTDGAGGLMLSPADLIIDTPTDYSGPVEFGPGGALFYGGSGTFGMTNLFRFSVADLAGATGGGPTLALDAPHLFIANGANAGLAFDSEDGLWQTNYGQLNLIDTDTAVPTLVGATSDSVGQIDFVNEVVFVNVTKSSFDRSAVYAVVPEPSAASLAFLGVILLGIRRRP